MCREIKKEQFNKIKEENVTVLKQSIVTDAQFGISI